VLCGVPNYVEFTLLLSELPAILAVFLGDREFALHIILVYDNL
jgi:hypothetical protein